MNCGIGYAPMFFQSGQTAHAINVNLGVVFNHRIAVGADFDMWAKSVPYTFSEFPSVNVYIASSLCIEPLIRPKKALNFSFPIKLGYGMAEVHDVYLQYYNIRTEKFALVQPGAMVWINLLKSVSIGAGAQYRVALNRNYGTFELFSGFSGFAVFRFKFYTKEYMAKAMERQKQYMEMQK